MKKGFTFAELMISLLVISVISAILYPTIAQFTPNANKPLFKSAYKTLTTVLYEIVNSRPDGELPVCDDALNATNNVCAKSYSATTLCTAFCEKANVIHEKDDDTCTSLCNNSTLTTTNGIRWQFSQYDGSAFTILVDVNAANNKLSSGGASCPSNPCPWGSSGVFYYDSATGDAGIYISLPNESAPWKFDREKLKVQDTFEIEVDKTGKIIDMSPAGWAHLEDAVSPD